MILYLRTLSDAHNSIDKLVFNLQDFLVFVHPDINQNSSFKTNIARCKEDVFISYIDNDKYIDKELKSLSIAFDLGLKPFHSFLAERKLYLQERNKSLFVKLGDNMHVTGNTAVTLNMPRLGHVFNIDVVTKMLQIHAESISRCKELSPLSELAKNSSIIFDHFLDQFGKSFLAHVLDILLEDILAMDKSTEPDLSALQIIQIMNIAVYDIQNYFKAEILPLINLQPTIHRESVVKKNEFMSALESKINVILKKIIDGIIQWCSVILGKQKRNDYRPKDSELGFVATLTSTVSNYLMCSQLVNVVIISRKFTIYSQSELMERIWIPFWRLLLFVSTISLLNM